MPREMLPSLFKDSFFPTFMRNISLFEEPLTMLPSTHDGSNISISEDDHNVFVEAALPGINEKDIEVTLEKGVIWIKGETKEEEKDKKRKYYRRASNSYSYQIALPGNIDEKEQPEAEYSNGILSITFHKIKKDPPKQIKINKKK